MAGYKDGVYVITPHLLHRFILKPNEAVDYFYGRKPKKTKNMALGEDWHKKLGYDNEEVFEREVEIDGKKVLIRGKPDLINEDTVEELKTLPSNFVSNRYLEATEVQMLAYLFITDRPNGRVVFVNRNTGEEIEHFTVFRDDEKLFEVIGRFLKRVKMRQDTLDFLVKNLKGPSKGLDEADAEVV